MKKTLAAAFLFTLLGTALSTGSASAGDKVDFSRYMQYPPALNAIASAVSAVGGCSVPITFEEQKEDGMRILSIYCFGTEEDEMAITIRFMDDGVSLLPVKFDYAG